MVLLFLFGTVCVAQSEDVSRLKQGSGCVTVSAAHILNRQEILYEIPSTVRCGLGRDVELRAGGLLYPGNTTMNLYGIVGLRRAFLEENEGAALSVYCDAEVRGWVARDLLWAPRVGLTLNKEVFPQMELSCLLNCGINSFGQSLGPLDYYLDKMRTKAVPMLGLGLCYYLGNYWWLHGDLLAARGRFYELRQEVWQNESMLAYSFGCGAGLPIGGAGLLILKGGLCYAPRQAFTEFATATRLVEDNEVRSARDYAYWKAYRYHLGVAVHFGGK